MRINNLEARWRRVYKPIQEAVLPGFRPAEYVYVDLLREELRRAPRWLNAGCGRGVLPHWMSRVEAELLQCPQTLVGLDVDGPSLRDNTAVRRKVLGDLGACPFADGTFELVAAHFVLEHVEDPRRCLAEVRRVLQPGGRFLVHTTNVRHYQMFLAWLLPARAKHWLVKLLEGRDEDDVFPTRYRINTPRKLKRLAEECGFVVREMELVNTTPQLIRLGPVVILELLITRFLNARVLRNFRSNIVTVLEKAAAAG